MGLLRTILIAGLLFLLAAGCTSKNSGRDKMNAEVNVFGVQLFSEVDYKELNGVVATEEPCLRGYERSFDALDVTVGYGFDKKIRKINTRNSGTTLFGVRPGMTFEQGKAKIVQAGFTQSSQPYVFTAAGYSMKFLVDGNNRIFGMTLEVVD